MSSEEQAHQWIDSCRICGKMELMEVEFRLRRVRLHRVREQRIDRMKILVIDDEEDKGRLYKEELEEEGYEVITASTGKQGLKLFAEEKPDLVTLDIWMSRRDEGIDVLRRLKEIKPDLPVIMLTAYDYRDDFGVWCADAYIVKSSDLSELKGTVKRMLNQRKREDIVA